MNITRAVALEHAQKPKSSRSVTLAAALFAVIAFGGALLFANSQKPGGNLSSSSVQIQQRTSTFTSIPTLIPLSATPTPVVALTPLYLTADVDIEAPTHLAAENEPQTFTPAPAPVATWPPTVTPIAGSANAIMLPPTTVPPLMSITPSQIEPIISSPAQLVKETRLPTGDASRALAWSPDGQIIAVAGYQGTWIYNANHIDGAAKLFPDNGPGVLEVAFSSDSSLLATLNSEQTLRLWDVESGIQLAEMPQAPLWDDLQFSANGQYLISKNSDQKINLAKLREGLLEAEPLISANLDGYYALLNPDGKTLAAYKGGSIILFGFETGEASANFDWPSAMVSQAAYSRDGQQLALGGDKEVVVLNADGGYQNSMNTLGMVTGLSFNTDGTMLVASMRSDKIQSLWLMNMIPGNTFYTAIFVYDLPLVNPAFSPTGNQVAVGTEDGRLFLLEVTSQ